MEKIFNVGGMTCAMCVAAVEKSVQKLNGVKTVSVSLVEKSMSVEFDEQTVSPEDIISAVKKSGYTAELFNGKRKDVFAEANKIRNRFFLSLAFLLPLMYLCMGKMLSLPVFNDDRINFSLSFALASVILVINRKFFINGFKAIKNGAPNMDTLVSLGSGAAFVFSVVETVLLFANVKTPSHSFFDSSAMVVTLVTLGKWLEELSKIRTGDAVEKLGKMLPEYSVVLKDGKETRVLSSLIEKGDLVVLRVGDCLSVDGIVKEGNATVDKSAITGESMPEFVKSGDFVCSGSIVGEGYIILEAKKVGKESLFSQIEEIVKKAGASKAPIQKFADKVAGVFVPIVSCLAVITFFVWFIISKDAYTSFNFGISVLVISCPCALGLATPVAVTCAVGKSARNGILFKNAEALQYANKVNLVLLDKTATLTVGKPKVVDYINFGYMADEKIFAVSYSLESGSSHPIADCVKDFCKSGGIKIEEFVNTIGKGVSGKADGVKYYLGNSAIVPFEAESVLTPSQKERLKGKTVLFFTTDDKLLAVFALSDYLKDDSVEAIKKLVERGIKAVMITGDNEETAKLVAKEAGIEEYYYSVLPQDKYRIAEKYKSQGYFVAMVGDGVNDSPALKSANLGIAMGAGTDIAIDSADVVIANGSLKGVSKTLDVSKRALRIIKQNLFWAFFYNVISIPVAAGALSWAGITLTPAIASACMCMSSLFVVLNALRISGKDKEENKNEKEKTINLKENIMEIKIEGMMCNHCVARVKEGIENISGVNRVEVNLKKKLAKVDCDQTVSQSVVDKIEELGYKVISVK